MKVHTQSAARRNRVTIGRIAICILAVTLASSISISNAAVESGGARGGKAQMAEPPTSKTQSQIDRNQSVQVFHTFRRPTRLSDEPCTSIHCNGHGHDHSPQH